MRKLATSIIFEVFPNNFYLRLTAQEAGPIIGPRILQKGQTRKRMITKALTNSRDITDNLKTNSWSSSAEPIPESKRIFGELRAPADDITFFDA